MATDYFTSTVTKTEDYGDHEHSCQISVDLCVTWDGPGLDRTRGACVDDDGSTGWSCARLDSFEQCES
jgi:hypothetical protein